MSRLIDADALINELNNSHYPGAPYIDAGISIAIGKVCDAQTIEPERKKGQWLPDNKFINETRFVCSCCMESEAVPTIGFTKYQPLWDFCPNCGADMRENNDIRCTE